MRRAAIIEAVGVVVPAHNEETLLPACLSALRRAVNTAGIPAQVLAVADTCTDQTVAAAQACGVSVISVRARNVGAARAAGMTELLRLTAGRDPAAIWLATTDADTVVTPTVKLAARAIANKNIDGLNMLPSSPRATASGTVSKYRAGHKTVIFIKRKRKQRLLQTVPIVKNLDIGGYPDLPATTPISDWFD